jgi:hypothetical protein
MSRRTRRKANRLDRATGAILAVLGLVLITTLAITVFWVKEQRIPVNADNCPRAGPKAVHLILVDRSDPVSDQQAQHIRKVIEHLKVNAAFGTRFDVYTFEGDAKSVLYPLLSICAPGRPEDANDMYENRERIRKRYEEGFSVVLDKTIEELLQESTRPNSPIIESLRAAAQTSFGSFDAGQIPLRATLVSDMVQHSAATSHFNSEPNFKQLARSAGWAALRPQLKGADVYVLYVLRSSAVRRGTHTPVQNRGHQFFWENLIEESGGRAMGFDSF